MKLDASLFEFEQEIVPGEEAVRIALIKSIQGRRYVAKSATQRRAFEETLIMVKSNFACPGVFPDVIQVHLQGEPGYVMEHVPGSSLQEIFHRSADPARDPAVRSGIEAALRRISELHAASREAYTSQFHETIVVGRLRLILECPLIQFRIDDLEGASSSFAFKDLRSFELIGGVGEGVTPASLCARATQAFVAHAPTHESLIHGDPHFGNIMVDQTSGAVSFIDPRCTWDGVENQKSGYFNPLYDAAAICHSFFANANIRSRIRTEIDRRERTIRVSKVAREIFETHFDSAMASLKHYLGRDPLPAEIVRFVTYLACSLSGTMRYRIWTPCLDNLLSMYVFTCLTLLEAAKAADREGATQ